jgi:hypothetical protein
MKKMHMQEVFDAIKTEREYQDAMIKKSDRPDMVSELNVGSTLTAIRVNLQKAEEEWYKGSTPHQNTMEYLRKVAGLIVQAAEENGMPSRVTKNFNVDLLCEHTTMPKFKEDCNLINCRCVKKE